MLPVQSGPDAAQSGPDGQGGSGGAAAGQGGTAAGGSGGVASSGSYLPVKVGNKWTYLITRPGVLAPSYKVSTIDRIEKLPGTTADNPNVGKNAFHHVTLKGMATMTAPPTDKTEGWWLTEGGVVKNVRELDYRRMDPGGVNMGISAVNWWLPYATKLDENLDRIKAGAVWQETYQDLRRATAGLVVNGMVAWFPVQTQTVSREWKVITVGQPCSVRAGMYPDCLVISHMQAMLPPKTFTFARGVGKVKEVGGQTEELVEFTPGP